jgi:hypothetical protein
MQSKKSIHSRTLVPDSTTGKTPGASHAHLHHIPCIPDTRLRTLRPHFQSWLLHRLHREHPPRTPPRPGRHTRQHNPSRNRTIQR